MNKKIDESKNIINYLKYQRVFFNRDLPKILEYYSYNSKKLKQNEKELISHDIKISINIFKDICYDYNINYLNYILILESLSNDKLKNLYRFFSFKWIKLLNKKDNVIENDKHKYKFKHSYSKIYHSSEPKKFILDTLQDLKKKKNVSIIYFIGCMNQYIT